MPVITYSQSQINSEMYKRILQLLVCENAEETRRLREALSSTPREGTMLPDKGGLGQLLRERDCGLPVCAAGGRTACQHSPRA